jgi:hypothetical protein
VTRGAATTARRRRRDGGEALLLALFVLLLLGISLLLLALGLRLRMEEQQREVRRVRLDLLIDGVTAETLARLAVDPSFPGVAERRDGAGRTSSEVQRVGEHGARVEVHAAIGPRRGAAVAWVRVLPAPPRVVRWERGGARSGGAPGGAVRGD